jgi:hypothetical protein
VVALYVYGYNFIVICGGNLGKGVSILSRRPGALLISLELEGRRGKALAEGSWG